MSMELSRRSFLKNATFGAMGFTAAGLVGCNNVPADDSVDIGKQPETQKVQADESKTCDVLVVGVGASGFQAALGASKLGAKVIAIDLASSMTGTTNTTTSGYLCVGDRLQLGQPFHYEVREIFDLLNEYSNYCFNMQTLKAMLEASSRSSNNLIDAGVPLKTIELPERAALTGPTLGQKCGHPYASKGEERAAVFQAALDKAGVETVFGTRATELIVEGGDVKGVRCENPKGILDIMAGAICLCTGGFLGNEEMVAKYYAGSRIVPMGNPACVGDGINMALSVGGQIGKAFSLSSNEYGGAHFDATPMFSFRPNSGSNEAMRLVLLGSLLVDNTGKRFVSEELANKEAMHCAEPFIRAKTYYTVVDQEFVDYVAKTPLGQIMGDGRMKTMFAEYTAETLYDDINTAISQGWVVKANTIGELAKAFDLQNLEQTVESYNGYCDSGTDEEFYNAPEFMHKLSTPPYYIVQSYPAGWLTLGGMKCDASCQLLDADNKPISRIYVAGADADLFCAPYIAGGSANGFAQASGLIAGESAAHSLGF